MVPLAVADLLEAADRVRQLGVLAGLAGEHLGDEERLRHEPLDPPGAVDVQLVVFRQLVDAQDRDDVAQLLVALQGLLDAAGDVVMLLADVLRVEDSRARAQGVDRRIDPLLRDRSGQHDEGVQEAEGRGGRRVGQVVGRNVDGLHRRDRAFLGRGDSLLQGAHLGRQGRLITDVRRHPSQERRDLRARLAEPEDVVDEEQRVGAGGIAEPLGHRQGRETRPAAGLRGARSSGRST